MNQDRIIKGYEYAKEIFSEHDIDTDKAMSAINDIAVSMHCWQGDDVGGKGFHGGEGQAAQLVRQAVRIFEPYGVLLAAIVAIAIPICVGTLVVHDVCAAGAGA